MEEEGNAEIVCRLGDEMNSDERIGEGGPLESLPKRLKSIVNWRPEAFRGSSQRSVARTRRKRSPIVHKSVDHPQREEADWRETFSALYELGIDLPDCSYASHASSSFSQLFTHQV